MLVGLIWSIGLQFAIGHRRPSVDICTPTVLFGPSSSQYWSLSLALLGAFLLLAAAAWRLRGVLLCPLPASGPLLLRLCSFNDE